MALLADHIASCEKGTVAGWMGAALPLSALGTTALALVFPADDNAAFFAIAAIVALCVIPLLAIWGFAPAAHSVPLSAATTEPGVTTTLRNLSLLWLARALGQLAACFLLYYLFLHITGLIASDPAWRGHSATGLVSVLALAGAAAAMPAAVIGGRASDALRSRQCVMGLAALVMGLSLLVLGGHPGPTLFGSAFILFQLGLAAYLSVDTAFVAQLIGHHPRRGAILGVVNLTNTLPAILAPSLTLGLSVATGGTTPFGLIYLLCACGIGGSIVAVLLIRST